MKILLNTIYLVLGSIVAVAISIGGTLALSLCSAETANPGPGMNLTFASTIGAVSINIKSARLPDGKEFPNAGSFGYAENPLLGSKTMGAAPDGRQLPEWVDFVWSEPPNPEDPSQTLEQYRALPQKTRRVLIRNRIPQEVVDEVTEASRHPVKRYGTEKSLEIDLVWTSQGIRLRWRIWHKPQFNDQYYSHEGGDEIIPDGKTMIAIYANTMKDKNFSVNPGRMPTRHPAPRNGQFFSGSPNFADTANPLSGGGLVVAYENEPQLPESVDFDWRLFPLSVPRNSGEPDSEYDARTRAIFLSLPGKKESVAVRSRIPQDVQDEIANTARKAMPDKVSDSIIFIYFIWTDNGIKLHWRLLHILPDGRHLYPREGGDELFQEASR